MNGAAATEYRTDGELKEGTWLSEGAIHLLFFALKTKEGTRYFPD